ncbi:hypothetical protein ACVHQX_004269, partial [Shigella boydii]
LLKKRTNGSVRYCQYTSHLNNIRQIHVHIRIATRQTFFIRRRLIEKTRKIIERCHSFKFI